VQGLERVAPGRANTSCFLKLIGLSDDPLPAEWWEKRPEIVDGIWLSAQTDAIERGDILVYYAVGSGRLGGVAEVLYAPATERRAQLPNWPAKRREKPCWWMPVQMLHKIVADASALTGANSAITKVSESINVQTVSSIENIGRSIDLENDPFG
jgi:hypothetical protein